MPRTKPWFSMLAASAAAALAACDATPDDSDDLLPPDACSAASATATTSVLLSGMQFLPYCVTAPPGVEVTFTNADSVDHTVTADAGQPEPFDSGLLYPGLQFRYTFSRPETVRVHDRLHPQTSGVVIVQ